MFHQNLKHIDEALMFLTKKKYQNKTKKKMKV